jgi:hypothetical protein
VARGMAVSRHCGIVSLQDFVLDSTYFD